MASVARKDGTRRREDPNLRDHGQGVVSVAVDHDHIDAGKLSGSCSSGSDSSSTEEEERLRRLFQACDRDCDGYIDSEDLRYMCQQLGMEESVEEIMHQLGGGDSAGRISFEEFSSCRMQLLNEIEEEHGRESHRYRHILSQDDHNLSHRNGSYLRSRMKLPGLCSQQSTTLHQLLELHHPEVLQHARDPSCAHLLQLANELHLAALSSLKGEIIELSSSLQHVTADKDHVEKQLAKHQGEKMRIQREYEEKLEQQALRHEERITELHSVIAELRKKLDRHQINVIREEDEYEELDAANSNSNQSKKEKSTD